MKKNATTATIFGLCLGLILSGPMGQAAENWLKATPSVQKFFANGKQVALEAYAIQGHNYVKLRDVGRVMGFDVGYDAAEDKVILGADSERIDYAAQADPTIFTDTLTPQVFNAIRDCIVHDKDILAGRYAAPAIMANDDAEDATIKLGRWPNVRIAKDDNGNTVCQPYYPEAYQTVADHCRPFVDSLTGLPDAKRAEKLAFYICDRLTYEAKPTGVSSILSQDGVATGNCMSYSYCFQFLCDLAGIPCVLVSSDIHMWNRAYVDGWWWDVDVTANDCDDNYQGHTVLHPINKKLGPTFVDRCPEITAFAMELLVPGSTK